MQPWRGNGNGNKPDEVMVEPTLDEAAEVRRDAEESLVAALQESDTAVEAMQDSSVDTPEPWHRRHWQIGVAGLIVAALGILVTRRRN